MDERHQMAWLARRVGFGVRPGLLDDWVELGADAVLDQLTDPDAAGVRTPADPFDGLERTITDNGPNLRRTIGAWFEHVIAGERPLQTWMQWFWHDFFAVSAAVARQPGLIHDHFTTMFDHALGNAAELLRAMTIDGAMLVFLDGTHSTAEAPNENYGRELLELYSVGVGEFTEDDVRAAARALTGWVVRARRDLGVQFVPFRHDDVSQTLLGVSGVHDLDSVIAAVTAHPATAHRITRLLARRILGDVDDVLVARHAEAFATDLELAPLIRRLLEDGLDGAGSAVLIEPFPWLASAVRAVGSPPRHGVIGDALRMAGQIPFLPPNVGGFPPPASYLTTSATIARFNLANAIADGAASADRPTPATEAAVVGDLAALAEALGLPSGFSPETRTAVASLSEPADRLAAALASPDLIVSLELS